LRQTYGALNIVNSAGTRMINRYDAEGAQSTFQLGSNEQVLSNKLGITDPEDMDDVELVLLEKLYQSVLIEHLPDRPLTVQVGNETKRLILQRSVRG
jgi:hypothetical protein